MVAIAAPPAIVSAIFALLFMLAWAQWGHGITGTLNIDLPLIGNVIGKYVGYALEGSYQVLVGWFDSAVAPAAELILRPVLALENTVGSLAGAAENTYNALWSVVNRTIPAAINAGLTTSIIITQGYYNDAVGVAQGLYNTAAAQIGAAIAYSQQLYNQSVAVTTNAVAGALAYSQQLYNQGVAYTNTAVANLAGTVATGITQAESYTLRAYQAATGYAETLALKGEQDLATATTAIEAYAQTTATDAVGALATDLDHAISSTLAGIYTDVDGAVQDAVGVITTGDADILAALKAFPASVPLDIAGLASLTGVTSLTLARYLRDCGLPNCQNLSQLGRDLQALLGLVEDASFLAFLVELVRHPSGAAGLVENTFGDAISDTVGAFRSLVGV